MRAALLIILGATTVFMPACRNRKDTTSSGDNQEVAGDKDRLQGVWTIESAEFGDKGDAMDDAELKAIRFHFVGDKLTMTRSGKSVNQSTFSLNTGSEPKTMRLPDTNDEWLYKFEGDTLVLAMTKGAQSRPTEFKSRPSSGTRATARSGEPIPKFEREVNLFRLRKTNETSTSAPPTPRSSLPTGRSTEK